MTPVPHLLRTRILHAAIAFVAVIGLGTVGYMLLLQWDPIDALYMSVITISTVGYREVVELDAVGKLFTVMLIVVGVGSFTYLISTLHNYLIAGQLFGRLERRSMEKRVEKATDHIIICGYGRMGAEVAHSLIRENVQVVVVERDAEQLAEAIRIGAAGVAGDAEDDTVLRKAGVERARALIAVVDDDASNLMITLTARGLNSDLYIVSRINRQASERKLKQAGADRVLWPYGLAGTRIAQLALRPGVVEFLDIVQHGGTVELKLEEELVAPGAALLRDGGLTVAGVRRQAGATIVAIRREGGQLDLPEPDSTIGAGDLLLAIGTNEQLDQLRRLAGTA